MRAFAKEEENERKVSVSITKVSSNEEVSSEEPSVTWSKANSEQLLTENNEDSTDDQNESQMDVDISLSGKKKTKQLRCEQCDKTVSSKKNLQRHIDNIHSRDPNNPKPYQCSTCEKSFKTESYVQVHEKIHSRSATTTEDSKDAPATIVEDEDLFQCNGCPKKFKTEWFMKTHMKSHTVS